MQHSYFFGYGSLVNRKTHAFDPAHKARCHGWRRAWRFTDLRDVSFLTVIPDPDCAIDGLMAGVPHEDWDALDQREHAYDRLPAAHSVVHDAGPDLDIAIYAIAPARLNLPDAHHPVLLSYIDVVVQGYLNEYGAAGADHFFGTTTGWEAPILNDRAAPRYPRAQRLSDGERAAVDTGLARMGSKVVV